MLIRAVKLKLFEPGNKKSVTQRYVAGPGRHFTAANVEKILTEFVDKVEEAMPGRYRLVAIGPGEFNLVRVRPEEIVARIAEQPGEQPEEEGAR